MQITEDQLRLIAGSSQGTSANMQSVIKGLVAYGGPAGVLLPHRLAHYLGQLAHESGGFRYDREVWGPTPAQARYEGRVDLGNTQPGDGERFAGRGPIQITGGANVRAFRDWCRAQGLAAPDFEANPELMNTDPWEGLGPIWYWTTRKLNRYADENNIEQITKRINGGLNGFEDRIRYYVRAALVLLGHDPADIKAFQAEAQRAGLLPPDTPTVRQVDGDPGPLTRAALHQRLSDLAPHVETKPSPVETEVEVPVVPKGADRTLLMRVMALFGAGSPLAGLLSGLNRDGMLIVGGISVVAIVIMLWNGERIAARARAVLKAFQ